MNHNYFPKEGDRVRIPKGGSVDRYPHCLIESPMSGTVSFIETVEVPGGGLNISALSVKLDYHVPELDEWENCIDYNGDPPTEDKTLGDWFRSEWEKVPTSFPKEDETSKTVATDKYELCIHSSAVFANRVLVADTPEAKDEATGEIPALLGQMTFRILAMHLLNGDDGWVDDIWTDLKRGKFVGSSDSGIDSENIEDIIKQTPVHLCPASVNPDSPQNHVKSILSQAALIDANDDLIGHAPLVIALLQKAAELLRGLQQTEGVDYDFPGWGTDHKGPHYDQLRYSNIRDASLAIHNMDNSDNLMTVHSDAVAALIDYIAEMTETAALDNDIERLVS